jgi:hypothetical protein
MATSIDFPAGIVAAIEHLSPIPFPFDAGIPGNPVIPGNPIFEAVPAAPLLITLFEIDVVGVAGLSHDPLIG